MLIKDLNDKLNDEGAIDEFGCKGNYFKECNSVPADVRFEVFTPE
jgi:hypothetical protein